MATLTREQCATPVFLKEMHRAGMRGVRINSAHVTPEELYETIQAIRHALPSIIILMDTKGPEIRTTTVATPITYLQGQTVELRGHTDAPTTPECITMRVHEPERFLKPGHTISIDDGELKLTITSITHDRIRATITKEGTLDSNKSVSFGQDVNLPPLPALSERDLQNIKVAKQCHIDWLAHSFVRTRDDVTQVRQALQGSSVKLMSKIETREAVENLPQILSASDGLLVARGDLGTQIPLWQLPAIQMRITSLCRQTGKPAIVATQIMQSMLHHPTPTRAELSDIAMGVIQVVDALLLCGETAQGAYPQQCVDIMQRTITATRNGLGAIHI